MKLSVGETLTTYDAPYLYTAMKYKLKLVTDDRKLANKARKYVEVLTSKQIAREQS